jgi:hypothetical protein
MFKRGNRGVQVGRDLKAKQVVPALQAGLSQAMSQQGMALANSSDDHPQSAVKAFLKEVAEAELFAFGVIEIDNVVTWLKVSGAKGRQPGRRISHMGTRRR